MATFNRWTDEEDQYLTDYFHNTPDKILVEHLGRTISAVRKRANDHLHLKKSKPNRGRSTTWTSKELQFICDNWNIISIVKFSKILKRSKSGVYQQAVALGLHTERPKQYDRKSYRDCLTDDQADRMEVFLRLVCNVKRVADRLGKQANINMDGLRDAFRVAEGRV